MTGPDPVTVVAGGGFDVARVERWLAANTGVVPPLAWQNLHGGRSNLTFRVTDHSGREVVIRRPPLGPTQPRAHDMSREHGIMRALRSTDVPVPQVLALCDDPNVADCRFFVMSWVEGRPLAPAAPRDWLLPTARPHAGESLMAALADLHAVDPGEVGLAGLGPTDGFIDRQLRTWHRSWCAHAEAGGYDDERVHWMHRRLTASVPPQLETRVVHGDFGPHNALFLRDGQVSAVLDWEIATLGDPLSDLAYAVIAWTGPHDVAYDVVDTPTSQPGFADRSALIATYAAATGRDVSGLGYYLAFNAWKRACMRQGVHRRMTLAGGGEASAESDAALGRLRQTVETAAILTEQHLR